jgi:hypothetical protein
MTQNTPDLSDLPRSNTPLPGTPTPQVDYPAMIHQMQQQLHFLSTQVQLLSSTSQDVVSSPSIALPVKFSGNRKEFRGFISQLELVFRVKAREYSTDSLKISTFGTLLEGKALKWFLPFIEKGLIDSTTTRFTFLSHLSKNEKKAQYTTNRIHQQWI